MEAVARLEAAAAFLAAAEYPEAMLAVRVAFLPVAEVAAACPADPWASLALGGLRESQGNPESHFPTWSDREG